MSDGRQQQQQQQQLDWYRSRPWRELAAGTSRHGRLGPMPVACASETLDERLVHAPLQAIFDIARTVEHWPAYLPHYRYVRWRERRGEDEGLVEMSANRPFGLVHWPTWWLSEMAVQHATEPGVTLPTIRFRHVQGITAGMEVEWSFIPEGGGTRVRILHAWNGPRWPLVGVFAATTVIGPVFVHGIASRTLAGLARVAERGLRGAGAMVAARSGPLDAPGSADAADAADAVRGAPPPTSR